MPNSIVGQSGGRFPSDGAESRDWSTIPLGNRSLWTMTISWENLTTFWLDGPTRLSML